MTRTFLLMFALAATVPAGTSRLWGGAGELWDPLGRLPDYSYAGYHRGEDSIPDVPVVANVRDFGAAGDGVTDDTEAFKNAIASVKNGALLIPRGRYVLSDSLCVSNDSLVLRGEGSDSGGTVLAFTRGFKDILGGYTSWYGYGENGMIAFGGNVSQSPLPVWGTGMDNYFMDNVGAALTLITDSAARGDFSVIVASAAGLTAGRFAALCMRDDSLKTLFWHFHNEQVDRDFLRTGDTRTWSYFAWPVQIKSVDGDRVEFFQPLRFDVSPEFQPALHVFDGRVRESGIEHLRIEFPHMAWHDTEQEQGYIPFTFNGAINCWARDVYCVNSDGGPNFMRNSKNCTMQGIVLRYPDMSDHEYIPWGGSPTGEYLCGHMGFGIYGHDCLLADWETEKFLFDVTVNAQHTGNVVCRGKGTDIGIDHHTRGPFENLFSDLDMGLGTRPYFSSGPGAVSSGARETFWNLHSANWTGAPGGPHWGYIQANVVPCRDSLMTPEREWFEPVGALSPPDLYASQLARRKAALKTEANAKTLPLSPAIRCAPNPFNSQSAVSVVMPLAGQMRLEVYDCRGSLVRTLASGRLEAGRHGFVWQGTGPRGRKVASGVYFYCIRTGNKAAIVKTVLDK